MVCPRCIDTVHAIFEALNIEPISIQLGEVTITNEISSSQKIELEEKLTAKGFELLKDQKSKLIEQIKANIPFASAVAFIVFVMIYLPCLAASMVFTREAGGWKYLLYLFISTTITAWVLSFIAYRVTLMIT